MDQSQTEFFDYLEMLYRRKWTIILSAVLGTGIAVFIAYTSPPSYRSTTFILVEQQKISKTYVTPTDSTPFEQRLSTIQQQVMSRTNLERIIGSFNLYKGDERQKDHALIRKVRSALGLKKSKPTMESTVENMRGDIEIEVMGTKRRGGGAEAFRISYVGRTPEIAMQVTNVLASLFIEENLRIKEQYAEGTSEFLAKEMEKAKEDLTSQEAAIRRFKERSMGALPGQLDANLRTLDRLQLELQSVNETMRNALDRKSMIEELSATFLPTGKKTPRANPLEELVMLKNELAALLSIYKESYPDVIIVKNRINDLEKRLAVSSQEADQKEEGEQVEMKRNFQNREMYAALLEVNSQIMTIKVREARIRNQINQYEKRVEGTPANEEKLTDLTRDYDITRHNYQSLLEKKLNAKLAQNLEKRQKGARFRVVDPANLPEKPFKQNRPMIILFGVLGGTGVGLGFVLLLEFLNPAFRKPEDFIGVLDQPVLVSIPLFTSNYGKNGFKRKSKIKEVEKADA